MFITCLITCSVIHSYISRGGHQQDVFRPYVGPHPEPGPRNYKHIHDTKYTTKQHIYIILCI